MAIIGEISGRNLNLINELQKSSKFLYLDKWNPVLRVFLKSWEFKVRNEGRQSMQSLLTKPNVFRGIFMCLRGGICSRYKLVLHITIQVHKY